jgi:hypothetical protein
MTEARRDHTVTVLDAHHLLVAGGRAANGSSLASAEVLTAVLVGEVCDATRAECLTGHCVDGVCCKAACEGQCEVCDPSGTGFCQKVTGAPKNGRPACGDGYLCNNGACATFCSATLGCQDGYYCDGATCQRKKPLGGSCKTVAECAGSVACVDGYCCDSACSGQCENCGQEGHLGQCWPVVGAPVGRPACRGVGIGTECGMRCDGQNTESCKFPAERTPCGSAECANQIQTSIGECAAGVCEQVATPCDGYECKAAECRHDCAVDAECAPGYACTDSICALIPGIGEPCLRQDCAAGLVCTEGFCCGIQCEAGSSCAVQGHRGTCIKLNGAHCRSALECASGQCVDGVCCDSDCTGQCEACNSKENSGTCLPVQGPPVGVLREPCDVPENVCGARACDGLTRMSCEAFAPDTDVICDASRCEGSTFIPAAKCDGRGGCAAPTEIPCGEYACSETGCRTTCTSDADCSKDHVCRNNGCTSGARCDGETASISPQGKRQDCSPYRCRSDGACGVGCTNTEACAPDYVCDGKRGQCILATEGKTGAESPGCGCRFFANRESGPQAPVLALAGALAAFTRRRRRTVRAARLRSRRSSTLP